MTDIAGSFERRHGVLHPNAVTEGGWNKGTLLGRHLSALVAWGAEHHADPDPVVVQQLATDRTALTACSSTLTA